MACPPTLKERSWSKGDGAFSIAEAGQRRNKESRRGAFCLDSALLRLLTFSLFLFLRRIRADVVRCRAFSCYAISVFTSSCSRCKRRNRLLTLRKKVDNSSNTHRNTSRNKRKYIYTHRKFTNEKT